MQNFIQEGETLVVTAPAAVDSGDPFLVGSCLHVAAVDIASGATGAAMNEGVFELPKTSAQAWAEGDKLAFDAANSRLDSDLSKGPMVGFAAEAASNPSSTGMVKLAGGAAARSNNVAKEGSSAATSKATAGAVTLTAAEVLSGIVVADCAGAGRTYTLPTAALLVAAVPQAKVGDLLRLKVVNGSDAAETITIAEGSGGGFDTNQTSSSRVIPQNTSKDLLIRLTNVTASSEAYVVYA